MIKVITILIAVFLVFLFANYVRENFISRDEYNKLRKMSNADAAAKYSLDGCPKRNPALTNCSNLNNLLLPEKCKKQYCSELQCEYENGKCTGTAVIQESEDDMNSKMFSDTYGLTKGVFRTKLPIYQSNVNKHKGRCKLVNEICENKEEYKGDRKKIKDCIVSTCSTNDYCNVVEDQCEMVSDNKLQVIKSNNASGKSTGAGRFASYDKEFVSTAKFDQDFMDSNFIYYNYDDKYSDYESNIKDAYGDDLTANFNNKVYGSMNNFNKYLNNNYKNSSSRNNRNNKNNNNNKNNKNNKNNLKKLYNVMRNYSDNFNKEEDSSSSHVSISQTRIDGVGNIYLPKVIIEK